MESQYRDKILEGLYGIYSWKHHIVTWDEIIMQEKVQIPDSTCRRINQDRIVGERIQNMKKELAIEILIGLGKEAVTKKCSSKQSKSVSISGRKMSEREVGC